MKRFVFTTLAVLMLAGCQNPVDTEDPDPNLEDLYYLILAEAAPPLTTYTVSSFTSFRGGVSSFEWSGPNCGSATGSTTSTLVWDHGGEGCEHTGEDHPDATIFLYITGDLPTSDAVFAMTGASEKSVELECTYTGAASGAGPSCVPFE